MMISPLPMVVSEVLFIFFVDLLSPAIKLSRWQNWFTLSVRSSLVLMSATISVGWFYLQYALLRFGEIRENGTTNYYLRQRGRSVEK